MSQQLTWWNTTVVELVGEGAGEDVIVNGVVRVVWQFLHAHVGLLQLHQLLSLFRTQFMIPTLDHHQVLHFVELQLHLLSQRPETLRLPRVVYLGAVFLRQGRGTLYYLAYRLLWWQTKTIHVTRWQNQN